MTNEEAQEETKAMTSGLQQELILVGKKSLVYVAGRALSQAVGFIMIPVYTRLILPRNYGVMELIDIVCGLMMVFISVGVAESMARFYYAETDTEKRNQMVSTIIIGLGLLALPIVLTFVGLAGILSSLIIGEVAYRYYLQIAIVTVWFFVLCEISFTYLRMLYMARLFVVVTIIQLILALSLNILFVVYLKLDILGIIYSTLITQALTGVVLCAFILKRVGCRVSLGILEKLMRFGLPLVPSRMGLVLGFDLNRFFVRWFGSSDPSVALAMVGLLSLGSKFALIIDRFINAPFNSFWGPRRMELLLEGEKGARETVARICTYSTMISVYAALGVCAGIESVIQIVADPKYYGAHVVVPFLALSFVALGLERHFIAGILYSRKTIWSTYISMITLVVIICWNYVFVPRYGLIGAATSSLAGLAVRTALVYIASQRLYFIPFEIGRIFVLVAIAFCLYGVSQVIFFSSPWLTFLGRTGFVALYPLGLLMVRFYKREELSFFCQKLRKNLAMGKA